MHRYREVAEGKCLPRYMDAKSSGLLDDKISQCMQLMESCCLCERRCGVNRLAGEKGFCGTSLDSRISFEQILWGEEPPLIPSHEIFFTGCNLRCKYCYSWESVINPNKGKSVTVDELASIVSSRKKEGAVNLNLIGGEPTVNILAILDALNTIEIPTAVVWNSNFYMSSECMELLDGIVDLYAGDFRFGCNECSESTGGVINYVEVARRNFLLASQSSDVIIRHLVMPGHIDCCLVPIADWISQYMPDIPFNLMFQYTPFYGALDDAQLSRSITGEEQQRALEIVQSRGLNTQSWKIPLRNTGKEIPAGIGEIETTVTIRPDGRVCILHAHKELLDITDAMIKADFQDEQDDLLSQLK